MSIAPFSFLLPVQEADAVILRLDPDPSDLPSNQIAIATINDHANSCAKPHMTASVLRLAISSMQQTMQAACWACNWQYKHMSCTSPLNGTCAP